MDSNNAKRSAGPPSPPLTGDAKGSSKRDYGGESPRFSKVSKAACTNCRARKVKCDGLEPCQNCKARNEHCQFKPSERGRIKRRKTNLSNKLSNGFLQQVDLPLSPPSSSSSDTPESHSVADINRILDSNFSLFYKTYVEYFYAPHPFVHRAPSPVSERALAFAIAAVAARWLPQFDSYGEDFANMAVPLLGNTLEDIQAMILLVVYNYCSGNPMQAVGILDRASKVPIVVNEQTELTLQELWMLAVMLQSLGAGMYTQGLERCTEIDPDFQTLYQRLMVNGPQSFSPAAYRILSFKILDLVNHRKYDMETTENIILQFLAKLPTPHPGLSEEIFTAHFVVSYARILLHRENAQHCFTLYIAASHCITDPSAIDEYLEGADFGHLKDPQSIIQELEIRLNPEYMSLEDQASPANSFAMESSRWSVGCCEAASQHIVQMSQPNPDAKMDRHSPFFTCPLTLATLVQLAVISMDASSPPPSNVHALSLGLQGLRRAARKWGNAKMLSQEVQMLSSMLLDDSRLADGQASG